MAGGFSQWGNDLYLGRRSYAIVRHRWWWFGISAVLVLISTLLVFEPGLNAGIDFRGGSEFRVSNSASQAQQPAIDAVSKVASGETPSVTTLGSNGLRVQTVALTIDEIEQVRANLAAAYDVPEDQVTSALVGPSWGKDVSRKAMIGLFVFLGLVALVLTAYFRNWRMAVAALVALFHDLLITVGIYAAVGWEVTPATVIGFLTILGYSIYDTVVVFDKVRENTDGYAGQTRSTYSDLANLAINQTLVRSINTTVVALLPVGAILFIGAFVLGAGTLRDIALALFVGMAVGAYSSIFLATPLEVALREHEKPVLAHTKRVLAAREQRIADGVPEEQVVASATAQLHPGTHLGQAAQPKRRKR